MEARKVLIADCNEDFRSGLAEALRGQHYVHCCATAGETLLHIRRDVPDLLVLELQLPEMDGLSMLEILSREHRLPTVLVVTTFVSDYLERAGSRLGVAYIMRKPCHIHNVASRVTDILQHGLLPPQELTAKDKLEQILASLSIYPNSERYDILADTVFQLCQDLNQGLCKEVYPIIARRHRITSTAIESAIRRTLDEAFNMPQWGIYFPGRTKHPSNKHFLQTIARQLLKELGKL